MPLAPFVRSVFKKIFGIRDLRAINLEMRLMHSPDFRQQQRVPLGPIRQKIRIGALGLMIEIG